MEIKHFYSSGADLLGPHRHLSSSSLTKETQMPRQRDPPADSESRKQVWIARETPVQRSPSLGEEGTYNHKGSWEGWRLMGTALQRDEKHTIM